MDMRIVVASVGLLAAPLSAAPYTTVMTELAPGQPMVWVDWLTAGTNGQIVVAGTFETEQGYIGAMAYLSGPSATPTMIQLDEDDNLPAYTYPSAVSLIGGPNNPLITFETIEGQGQAIYRHDGTSLQTVKEVGGLFDASYTINRNGTVGFGLNLGTVRSMRPDNQTVAETTRVPNMSQINGFITPVRIAPDDTLFYIDASNVNTELRATSALGTSVVDTGSVQVDDLLGVTDRHVIFSTPSGEVYRQEINDVNTQQLISPAYYNGAVTPGGRVAINTQTDIIYWNGQETISLAAHHDISELSLVEGLLPMINDSGSEIVIIQSFDPATMGMVFHAWDTRNQTFTQIAKGGEALTLSDGSTIIPTLVAGMYTVYDFTTDAFSDDNQLVFGVMDESGYFQIVSTTVPEPAAALGLLGAPLLLLRRRRAA